MKSTILIVACLAMILLSVSVFARSDDQNRIKIQSSVTDAVYGKGEILK